MTIPLDPRFIPAFSIEDVLLDKDTGAPLSGGLVYFEQDNQRGMLKPVYQITGTSPAYTFIQLPNPMTLSSIGTFEDSLSNPVIPYFYPYDAAGNVELYYVRVTNSNDVPQFDREAQPYIGTQSTSQILSLITNELSNPQFAEVLFDTNPSTFTYTVNTVVNAEISIAPDWDLVVSAPGAGTITVAQLKPVGSLNIVTNPGTLLTITSSGLTKLQLRQRLYGSPNLWGSGYLSGTFVAKTYSGTAVTIDMLYAQSNGTIVNQVIKSASLAASGAYARFAGSVFIDASNSTQTFPDAYIDIFFSLPLSIQIDITSVMVAFTGATSINDIGYDQESLARQTDHLFHYYKDPLLYKPIPSYLVGWDFPLNPALANTSTVAATANVFSYTWDQTILFQSTVSRIATSRASSRAMVLTNTGGATQVAIIQYLPQETARDLLKGKLSVTVQGNTSVVAGVKGVVSLWVTTNAAVPVLPLGFFTGLDANGKPSAGIVSDWTEIPRNNNLGDAIFHLGTTLQESGFNEWNLPNGTLPDTTTYFAIVVGTASIPDAGTVSFNSVSLVAGDVPTIPAPQTLDEVLRESQYYYRKSFLVGTKPVQAAGLNSGYSTSLQVLAGANATLGPIIRFDNAMRAAPAVTFFNPIAANGQIRNITGGNDWSACSTSNLTANGFNTTGTTNGISLASAEAGIHWTADARLGVV